MELSLTVFGLTAELYPELAVQAEASGFEMLWLSDHLITPATFAADYPYSDSGKPGYDTRTILNDVWVLVGHLSAVTSRITFGSGVYILPLRNPFVTALAVATASRLSQGRVALGVGSGWMREEFETVGADFDTRGKRLDECLDVLAGLFTGEEFSYRGTFFDFPAAGIGGPSVADIPIIFGGVTEVVLRRTARRGDGWFGPVCTLEESRATADRLDRLRTDSPLTDQPLVHYPRLVGDWTYNNLARYRDAGFERVVLSGGGVLGALHSPAARADALEEVAEAARRLG
jgi:probable F420-dependent oxidoreductase